MSEELKEYILDNLKSEYDNIDEKLIKEYMFICENSTDKFPVNIDKLIKLNVYSAKKNAKKKLIEEFKLNEDYIISKNPENTGGRPSEEIKLTIECFKFMCISIKGESGYKIRKYYCLLEKIYKNYMNEVFETNKKENDYIKNKLLEEQKENTKMKKYICTNTLKNNYRYQFQEKPCVYILHNPDDMYDKYKVGMSNNINNRLKSDRTMIPNIKIKYILYVNDNKMFENMVLMKLKDKLMMPSHEWVLDSLQNIINVYKQINNSCGFNGIEETELWRYNLEENPNKDNEKKENHSDINNRMNQLKDISETEEIKEIKELTYRKTSGVLTDRLYKILPKYINKGDYIKKNENAPDGQRYCNGFCQKYKFINEFLTTNTTYNNVCEVCKNMELVAKIMILNGKFTAEDIRKNPNIIVLNENERVCRKCENIKDKNEYEKNRIVCKTCRSNDSKSKISNYCEIELKNDAIILYNMRKNKYEMKVKLNDICKDNLIKIIKQLKIGRKSSDTKETMVNNVMNYFETLEFQSLDNFLNMYFNS